MSKSKPKVKLNRNRRYARKANCDSSNLCPIHQQ